MLHFVSVSVDSFAPAHPALRAASGSLPSGFPRRLGVLPTPNIRPHFTMRYRPGFPPVRGTSLRYGFPSPNGRGILPPLLCNRGAPGVWPRPILSCCIVSDFLMLDVMIILPVFPSNSLRPELRKRPARLCSSGVEKSKLSSPQAGGREHP